MAETYTLPGHGLMIADAVRMDAYQAALERTVRPGCVVLDIGTGTGMMALMACRLGARRVYAVDPGDAIHLARAAARDSGFADRIEFIQDLSTRVRLPEHADVIVSDLRGVLPVFQQHVPSLADARDRLLAPGGVLIPRADTLRAAPVEAEAEHRRITAPWDEHARGFDLSAARRAALNGWSKAHVRREQLVAEPRTWAVLEYGTRRDPEVRGTLEWTVQRTATAHGFAVWFHAELVEGVGFTTGPEGPETIYGSGFFPWLEPVALREGDCVAVDLQAREMAADHVWVWNTVVRRTDGSRLEFRQSSFLSQPSTPRDLRKRAHDFSPMLGEEGRIDRAVLEMMDGAATLEKIAREVQRRFPERFRTWEEALARAGRLSQAYADD
ncbi:MAG: 50S ribosomal protein L11 methyltransferase [Gemmatimonadetes bacterium]|nr:50S ribosomal protein L11 methyltransferase [Gemmatimonadota bacterium]